MLHTDLQQEVVRELKQWVLIPYLIPSLETLHPFMFNIFLAFYKTFILLDSLCC